MYPKIDHEENINKTTSAIKTILLFSAIMGLMAYIFILLLDPLPVVKISTASGKCVMIEIEGNDYDCSCFKDLKKYEILFIK